MRKTREVVSVRVGADAFKYLPVLARAKGQTKTDALASLIKEHEQAEPLTFKIVRVIGPNGEMYDVTVNGNTFAWSNALEGAMEALAQFRKKHDCDAQRFPLDSEMGVLDLRDVTPSERITIEDVKLARIDFVNSK